MRLLKLVPDDTNIHFLKWRVPFYSFSTLLIVASIALVLIRGLNLGVDFVGGQQILVTFTQSKEAPVAELREQVAGLGYGEPVIQIAGAQNEVSIRFPLPEEVAKNPAASDAMTTKIVKSIEAEFKDARIDDLTSVSGKVSGELFSTAMYALGFAMLAISIYIWVRFEWQFGVGALFALVHDVSLTLGMFALFQIEFDLKIVAAILTIIGYSLNDTIVVYDRIRENMKKYRKMQLPEILDLSVNETLARTVMTSLTILIVLVALLLMGPASLFGFTAAITLGIFVGTYSSVYMAAPILIWLGVDSHSFVPEENVGDKADALARGEA
ncbi:preprotein translocase subunit SecF [Erythrobacter sp. SG61-1L]|uniref:protein translocase subunit SecF n=1 Tax=Erythrobacter sp. SG61-1L TaxID=1603897 RepID=UPI0006C9307C|nr:protein translocase subunit SecF [Erythrobacter sp. SG61-1L]KPL67163.1 preprotein translocase subunit SecF [Erythrobacter sp. SG61-1L]